VRQKVEPTFDTPPPQAAEGATPEPQAETVRAGDPFRHLRIPSWRAAGAGAAGWIALACVALLAALPDVSEEVVVSLTRPSPTVQDVEATGSIAVAAGRPAPTRPAFTMAMGKGPSADRLWLRWSNLSLRNASLLRDVPPTVKPVPAEPDTFVLLAGEYESEDSARRACEAVKARFIACDVATTDGTVVPGPR
jgi:hypothetical protein